MRKRPCCGPGMIDHSSGKRGQLQLGTVSAGGLREGVKARAGRGFAALPRSVALRFNLLRR